MQLKCDGASFILQANTRSGGRYGVVLTIGLLVDAQGQIMPANQAWAWITERLGKQPLDCGLKKSRGSFAVHGAAYALTEAQRQGMAVRARVGGVEKSLHVFPPRVLAPWGAGLVGRPGWGHPQRATGTGQRLWRQPMARQSPRNGPRQRSRRSTRGAPCALGARPAGRGRSDPRATRRDRQLFTATAPAHTTAAVFGRAGCRLGSPAGPLTCLRVPICAGWTKWPKTNATAPTGAATSPGRWWGCTPANPRSAGICRVCAPGCFVQYADPAVAASEAPPGSVHRPACFPPMNRWCCSTARTWQCKIWMAQISTPWPWGLSRPINLA